MSNHLLIAGKYSLRWIVDNKEWLFSGAGVAVAVLILNFLKRPKTPFGAHQSTGDNSTNVQVIGDENSVHIGDNHYGQIGVPDPHDRMIRLEQLHRASIERCIERWVALGLPETDATAMSSDPNLGAPGAWFHEPSQGSLLTILGEIGAGKSLMAERLYQAAIRCALEDGNAPIPVYLSQDELMSAGRRLQAAVIGASCGLGDPSEVGVALFLDGLDESGPEIARRIQSEARALARTWLHSRIIATSRPMPGMGDPGQAMAIPYLTDAEAAHIVSLAAGREIDAHMLFTLPDSVRDAVHFPLFSIIYGVFLRDRDVFAPQSTGEMISHVVHQALCRSGTDIEDALALLKKLAILATDRGGSVHASEVGTRVQVDRLVGSRLVIERSGVLMFALSIFTEWFASESLADGSPPAADILADHRRIERWRYPLVLLTATGSHDSVTAFLAPLARTDPALAAQVIHEGLSRRSLSRALELPPPSQCGRRIRDAMGAWMEGIGPLAELIAPIRSDGRLCPIGVSSQGNRLTVGWFHGSDISDDVIDLGFQVGSSGPLPAGYRRIVDTAPCEQSAWAWQFTYKELADDLAEILRRRRLPIHEGPLAREAAWIMAVGIVGRGYAYADGIPSSRLESAMREVEQTVAGETGQQLDRVYVGGLELRYDPELLGNELRRARDQGLEMIVAPYQRRDQDISRLPRAWVWSGYSGEAMVRLVTEVYGAALDGYCQLVETWFPRLKHRLEIYAMMPVEFMASLRHMDGGNTFGAAPCMDWYIDSLPEGNANTARVHLVEDGAPCSRVFQSRTYNYRSLRNDVDWISPSEHTELLRIFGSRPATDIAYEWLWRDLSKIFWVDGMFNR